MSWEEQVEAIIREKFQGDQLSEKLEIVEELINLVHGVEIPSGVIGSLIGDMLRGASKELRPLSATYAGYQLGVAYERYQNTHRE